MHLAKCFSALVASGQGRKCRDLKSLLHQNLLIKPTGAVEPLVLQYKYGHQKDPESHLQLRRQLARQVIKVMRQVDAYFFGPDLEENQKRLFQGTPTQFSHRYPIFLDDSKSLDVLIFRRTIELSLSQGRWAGTVGHD